MSHKFIRRAAATVGAGMLLSAGAAILAPPAMAISSDYCGYGRAAGEPFCFEGSGYRGWRYHQASTGSGGPLINICVRAYTNQGGGYYRINICSGTNPPSNIVMNGYCNADPTTNSSVGWFGSGTVTLYGHADSRTCFAASTDSPSRLPQYVAQSLKDPSTASEFGADPASARMVAGAAGDRVFTLSGEQQRCVLRVGSDGYSSSCTTADALAKAGGQQLIAEQRDGAYVVYGLVGGDAVTVTTADGSRRAAPVSGAGATVARFTSQPVSATVETANGPKTIPLASAG